MMAHVWSPDAKQDLAFWDFMSFPVVFHLGPLVIQAHFLFEMLAYFVGLRFYQHLRNKRGDALDEDRRIGVMIGGILGAALGSKILGLLEHPKLLFQLHENLVYFLASKTIVGGLIGGLIGVEATKKLLGVSRSTGDLFCIPIILGMMIGRIGCFLAGVSDGTWGQQTDWILAMDGGDGVMRHPMPLYEIGVLSLIWLAITQLKGRPSLQDGDLFKFFMVTYLAWRFSAEFLKPSTPIPVLGISAIQFACLLTLLYYHKFILNFRTLLVR